MLGYTAVVPFSGLAFNAAMRNGKWIGVSNTEKDFCNVASSASRVSATLKYKICESMSVSDQLRTYPSPNPTLTLTCYQLTVFKSGEGQVQSCSV